MNETIQKEVCTRLGVIISAAQIMQSDIAANNLAHIRKQMEEIEQYSLLVRIDFNYLTNRTKT